MLDDLITPEGRAFADYVESINANPYPYDTEDHKRYDAEMKELEK